MAINKNIMDSIFDSMHYQNIDSFTIAKTEECEDIVCIEVTKDKTISHVFYVDHICNEIVLSITTNEYLNSFEHDNTGNYTIEVNKSYMCSHAFIENVDDWVRKSTNNFHCIKPSINYTKKYYSIIAYLWANVETLNDYDFFTTLEFVLINPLIYNCNIQMHFLESYQMDYEI